MKKPTAKDSTAKAPSKSARFFPWLYYAKEKDLGDRQFPTQIHKIRDGLAALEAAQLFHENGFIYGGSILNIPREVRDFLGPKAIELNVSLSSADVVFIPTRPPLDDGKQGERGSKPRKPPIFKSGTSLEVSIMEKLRVAFKTCKRDEIILNDDLILDTAGPPNGEDYKAIKFQQYSGGTVESLFGQVRRASKENNLAVGYLVSISDVPPGGFRVVASFGAGGTETLWFNFLMRTAHREFFSQALSKRGVHVWMLPFLVPDWAPTLLTCNPGEFEPKVECSRIIEWSRR